ncbi:MAG: sensor histidine kinase [Gemmatimonadota bacterium]
MTEQDLEQLAALIRSERTTLMAQWRSQVRELPSARGLDVPTLNDHIPSLLDELALALYTHSRESIPESLREGSSPAHGRQRLKDGFDIGEVVAEYNILRGCVHDMAEGRSLRLQGPAFHILNRVLDAAIAVAVQTFAQARERELSERREEYLAFVAHDLRTPLNAISLATKVLESSQEHPENERLAGASMLRILRRNVRELVKLVDTVLKENTNSQADGSPTLTRRVLDLWPLTQSLLIDLQLLATAAGTRLVNEVPDDTVAFADASLLRRVLQNLVANAIRHTPDGEVRVGARADGADGTVQCWVYDNGGGIPAAMLERVFDKGESSAEEDGGAGLGLTIVKSFVEAHGGTVRVESREGHGSTFHFTLPGRQGSDQP